MKYTVEHPMAEKDDGILSIILKYITLFIVAWFVFWIMVLWMVTGRESDANANWVEENPGIISGVIALLVVMIFSRRFMHKFSRGLLVSIEIKEDAVILGLINSYNGTCREQPIAKERFRLSINKAEDSLFGKQRILGFYDRYQLITRLNVERSAWCRHPDIETIITKLDVYNKVPLRRAAG